MLSSASYLISLTDRTGVCVLPFEDPPREQAQGAKERVAPRPLSVAHRPSRAVHGSSARADVLRGGF
jgi:hypothetical protein